MKAKKALTVSIVIPAYNEEGHLPACLEAIKRQTVKPNQVIVVDNNSTDATADIAGRYKFVSLAHESKQGLIAARNRGFQLAKNDILVRIDADTSLAPNWLENLIKLFDADQALSATGGLATATVLPPFWAWRTTWWARIYFWITEAYLGVDLVWGSNMALRRTAWLSIRGKTCLDDQMVHEDQDISLALAALGQKVRRSSSLQVRIDERQSLQARKFWEYFWRGYRTKRYHRQKGTYQQPTFKSLSPWRRLGYGAITALPALLALAVMAVTYGLALLDV